WSAIAARLPGRTDNEIKNYWNTHIRKRLLRMGIDPVTHSPRLDFLDLSSLFNSTQLNLSSLLGLQALVNPEIFKLANSLLLSHTENQELLSQNQNSQGPELLLQKLQQNQLLHNQSSIFQHNDQLHNQVPEIPNCTSQNIVASSSSRSTQGNMGHYMMNDQIFQENMMLPIQNYSYSVSDVSENSTIQSLNNNNNQISQNFSFDTSLSGTEEEKESYCSNFMKFEIPESLDFDDLL
ncbi:hypothetical protein HAX54_025702, partial [Datura stramonium]|nr:hypothetical protein [Datura stramonium]